MPESAKAEIRDVLDRGGRNIVAYMRGRAPRRTGALRAGITYRVMAGLKLRAGLIGTKRGRSRLFYGRIQDLGRRGQEVTVRRRRGVANFGSRKDGSGRLIGVYRLRVRSMRPKRFVTGRMPDLRNMLNADLKKVWSRILQRIGGA
ncbi:MAG: HK97 gp10 family phage protein [Pseudomonadota bacterium]|nr:HK97 gp10 family phage protein [Pseudomonadota bacterium]